MKGRAEDTLAGPTFLTDWRVRLVLAAGVAGVLTVRMLVRWNWPLVAGLVYNVPVFVVFGLWLTQAAAWLWRGRWAQLAVAAAVLAAVMARLRPPGTGYDFPASGHATFLGYVLVSTRRDPVLLWSAVVVMAEVAVIKTWRHDLGTLAAGVALGGALGLASRLLDRRRPRATAS